MNQGSSSSGRILVVDDEEELRNLLSLKLQRSGFEVDCAADGMQASEFINNKDYTAILCDLNLPNHPKGDELYSVARKSKAVFIAITGFTQDSPEVKAARATGIEHVFSKPLRLKGILDLISGAS
ncbi:response regulator [bacterium]|nr:response regulator [bacterium]